MAIARIMVLLLPALLLPACKEGGEEDPLADETARMCVNEHPASAVESDRTLAAAKLECLDAQESCSDRACADRCRWDELISEQAARCIASSGGFSEGVAEVRTNIGYSADQRRPAWSVTNTLVRTGSGSSGAIIWIDAETGEVLSMGGWEATP